MALGAGALASTTGFRVMASGSTPYSGRLLVTLELNGGADVTQLCDPKVNTPGELKINHWADSADPGEAGHIKFAPVADNFNFFNRFCFQAFVAAVHVLLSLLRALDGLLYLLQIHLLALASLRHGFN